MHSNRGTVESNVLYAAHAEIIRGTVKSDVHYAVHAGVI
jgi:hypothetical protein